MNVCSVCKPNIPDALLRALCLLCLVCGWLASPDHQSAWAQPTPDRPPSRPLLSLGATACVASANLTRVRNSQRLPQPLDAAATYYLRPWFGDLIDAVQVVWLARLNDRFTLGGHVLSGGSRAQTYGYQIYIAPSQGPRDPGDTRQLLLLAHELVHAQQYRRAGESLTGFCQAYIQAWEQSAGVYTAHALEREAFAQAFAFAQWLAQQLPTAAPRELIPYTHEGEGPQGRTLRLPRRLPTANLASSRPLAPPRSPP